MVAFRFSLSLVIALTAAHCAAMGPGDPHSPRLLVLANGSVIEGEITLDGDYYRVKLAKGQLQVRADQVDFTCQTMAEAYARRQARRIGVTATADSHLDLAQWCLQHELFEFAIAELAEARKIDPKHRLLPSVERRLTQSRELASKRKPHSEHKPTDVDQQVSLASASEETNPKANEVPQWARTEFIKRIQPMMINSCATAGCHALNSEQAMQIDRIALDGVGNPELFQRNLSAILAQVNFETPEESRLLEYGIKPHGKLEHQSKPLTPHQIEIMRAWVTQLILNEQPQEEHPRVSQIVVGMSGSATGPAPAAEEAASTAADPFDPAGFNQTAEPEAAEAEASSEPLAPELEAP